MGANSYFLHFPKRWRGVLAGVSLAVGALALFAEFSYAEQRAARPFNFFARALAEPASAKLPAGLCAPSLARGGAANRPQGQRARQSRA